MLVDAIALELSSHTEHWKENGQLVIHDHFFMLRDFSFSRKDFLRTTQPYRLQEGRVVIVKRGCADYSFNLVNHHFEAGDLVVFLANTLVEKHGHSADFEVDALSFDLDSPWLPDMERGLLRMKLSEQTRPVVMQHFSLLWEMAQHSPFPAENVRLLLNSLLLYVGRCCQSVAVASPASRREELLRRFISLVSQHAAHERSIPFYAQQLCVAPHYLSTLVKQGTGRTVMQWINQVAVTEAKVWLAYSDETAAQIADRLNFPCPASLSKFFKRETGLTPGEYRLRRA